MLTREHIIAGLFLVAVIAFHWVSMNDMEIN